MGQLWSDKQIVEVISDISQKPRYETKIIEFIQGIRDDYEVLVESLRQERADYHIALITESKTKDARIAELEEVRKNLHAVIENVKLFSGKKDLRIIELETELIACQSQLAATEMFK